MTGGKTRMFGLWRKVNALKEEKEENNDLKRRIETLQPQVDQQEGQLKALVEIMKGLFGQRIDGRIVKRTYQ